MTVLFPAYERDRISGYLNTSLIANRLYLERLLESWQAGNPDPRPLALARRATGLAHNDMEESVERVLTESWTRTSTRKASSEALLAFAAYLHRFSQSITGLVSIPGAWEWKASPIVQDRLDEVRKRLLWLEGYLQATSPPTSNPWLPLVATSSETTTGPSPGERQLTRLERQTQVMRRHLEAIRVQSVSHTTRPPSPWH